MDLTHRQTRARFTVFLLIGALAVAIVSGWVTWRSRASPAKSGPSQESGPTDQLAEDSRYVRAREGAGMTRELRRFYRLDPRQKLQHIETSG